MERLRFLNIVVIISVFLIIGLIQLYRIVSAPSEELFSYYLMEDGVRSKVYKLYIHSLSKEDLTNRSYSPEKNIIKSVIKLQSASGVKNNLESLSFSEKKYQPEEVNLIKNGLLGTTNF